MFENLTEPFRSKTSIDEISLFEIYPIPTQRAGRVVFQPLNNTVFAKYVRAYWHCTSYVRFAGVGPHSMVSLATIAIAQIGQRSDSPADTGER
ncbi:hypothetical protein BELL_0430g00070 [Botrytis elliptica]|uniref:Uncharacterized protein n=1 Tax=Botrytis elliptica TaxID=278938 RepID=A0A4Z1JTU2_9HELO|nr:hypothetical protein BELL_0430g00070 [Botrytis elliptica]